MIYIFAQNRISYNTLIPIFFGGGGGEKLVILTGYYVFTGYVLTGYAFTCRIEFIVNDLFRTLVIYRGRGLICEKR